MSSDGEGDGGTPAARSRAAAMSARAAASSSESFCPACNAFSRRSSSRAASTSGSSSRAPRLVLLPRTAARRASRRSWYLLRGASDASERPVEGVAGSDPAVSCCRNAAPLACFLRLYSSRRFLPLSRSLALRSMATARTAGPSGRAGWSRPRVRSTNARICRWEREPLGSHARSRSPRARASPTMARSRPSRRTRSRSMTEAGRSMSRSRASPGSGAPRADAMTRRTRLSEPLP